MHTGLRAPAVEQRELDYFEDRRAAAEHFCARFPGGVAFDGKTVLDFGCGHGAISVLAAQRGATAVLGVDVDDDLVSAARAICGDGFPDLADRVSFDVRDIVADPLPDRHFDLIVSSATFEHVTGLPLYLRALGATLRPGGRLHAGFSPLFNAPRGDHDRLQAPLRSVFPWAHLVWPRRWLLRRIGAQRLADVGLNGLALRDYLAHFDACELDLIHLEVNNQRSRAARWIEPLRAHTPLKELLSYSVYVILERPLVDPPTPDPVPTSGIEDPSR